MIRLVCMIVCIVAIVGCATTQPITSKDTMTLCKQICRGEVSKYRDDLIDCICK